MLQHLDGFLVGGGFLFGMCLNPKFWYVASSENSMRSLKAYWLPRL